MKNYELDLETAMIITDLGIHGMRSMLARGLDFREENGSIFIEFTSLMKYYYEDKQARLAVENALTVEPSWKDVESLPAVSLLQTPMNSPVK